MDIIQKKWCDFILNEGIMPTVLIRDFKNCQINPNNLCSLIANVLYFKEQVNLDFLNDKNIIKAAFLADPDLTNWLNSVSDLLYTIYTFASKESAFTNILNEACLSFIKLCPLVSDDRKQLYLANKSSLIPFHNAISDPKSDFKNYLIECGYSFNSANSYISAINKISKLTNIERNLWDISDADEMKRFLLDLEANTANLYDEYKLQNIKSGKILSNALKRYIEFLTGKDANLMFQTKNNQQEKIGDIVQNVFACFIQSGNVSEHEISQLMNMDYCKLIFKTRGNQYPILASEDRDRARYYKRPVKIAGKSYYISSQWYDEQLPYLKKWLKLHGVNI